MPMITVEIEKRYLDVLTKAMATWGGSRRLWIETAVREMVRQLLQRYPDLLAGVPVESKEDLVSDLQAVGGKERVPWYESLLDRQQEAFLKADSMKQQRALAIVTAALSKSPNIAAAKRALRNIQKARRTRPPL